jgi:hypothetical protein
MDPHASTKCAGRLLMGLTVMTSILLIAGCGSGSGIVHPLGGGFSNSSLSGQYVMKQTGFYQNQTTGNAQAFSEITVFSANGNGVLTIVENDGGPQGPGAESLAGTYSIESDGEGYLIFNNPTQSTYQITMIDNSHFYVIEGDTYATSAGYGVLQTSTAAPLGAFVFKAHNFDTSSRVGGITTTSTSFTGAQDVLTLGTTYVSQVITGTMTAPNSNGVGSFGGEFYYVVSPTEFFFMANPASGSLEIGEAQAQTGGPFTLATLAANNSYVFGSRGDTVLNQPGIHSAGVFTTDGSGNVTAGSVDYVRDFNVLSGLPFTVSGGTYTMDASGNGNGTITLPLSNGVTITQVFWMISPTSAYFLDNSSTAVEDGTFSLQSGGPFSALTAQAAFVMDGVDTTYKDRVGDFDPTSSGNFNWNEQSNSAGTGAVSIGTNGSYTVSSTANGRVSVVVNNVTPTLVFYLSSPNTGFMVQEDGADIGGVFTQQASN